MDDKSYDVVVVGGPAITCFNDFDRFCHFELDKIIKVDRAITCFNDFDRFLPF